MQRRPADPAITAVDARQWTQRVGAFAGVPALIERLGGNASAVLTAAGLTPEALSDPEGRVPYSACLSLLGIAAEQTGCPHFGLLTGRMCHLAELGVVGEVARHSPTVGRALESLTGHQHLHADGGLTFLLHRGGYVDLGYASLCGSSRGGAHMYDAVLAACMNVMEELYGPEWLPYEVLLPRSKPRDIAQYRALFKVVPHFDSDQCALRFPAQDLSRPVAAADPARRRVAEQRLALLARPQLVPQVYRALRKLMLEDRHSGDDVARVLGMHRRTLNRRLKEQGVTFQEILDEVRFDAARDLLANSDIHLDDIAAALGYAAVTPFMRTFRRWSGTTPGRWRRQERGGHAVA